ncbi:MAG: hypothetical protein AUG49_05025 [Catenulispora sp. 13_1_20CM_3_70_7]|nr:MAG: hypothetical protein AUG49_05025 [Catenulispora sp. 13_1_20CM_3_70_7]
MCREGFRCPLAKERKKYVANFSQPGTLRQVDVPVEATELPLYLLDLLTECVFTVYGRPMPGEPEDLDHLHAMGFLVRTFDDFAPNDRGCAPETGTGTTRRTDWQRVSTREAGSTGTS